MKSINRDKLILSLLVHDITAAINLAMRVRKVSFKLDYTDVIPKLKVVSPLADTVEVYMWTDPRKKITHMRTMTDDALAAFQRDIESRLAKMEAHLMFVAEKPHNKKPVCKLQVHVRGVRQIVLTIAETTRDHVIEEFNFQTPDGVTP